MSEASHGLPGVLGEIADLVGVGAALAVAEAVGGTRAYIARRPAADNWLIKAVGAEAAALIIDHFAVGSQGVEIEFPVGPAGSYMRERRQRAKRLADLAAQGLRTTDIARQAGMTRRGVQMHQARRRERGDDDQGNFGF